MALSHEFVQQMLAELAAFSADLVTAGRHGASVVYAGEGGGVASLTPFSLRLEQLQHFESLLPTLVSDAEQVGGAGMSSGRFEVNLVATPCLASAPSGGGDGWAMHRGRLVPTRYEAIEPYAEADPQPMGWLLFLVRELEDHLMKSGARFKAHIAELHGIETSGKFALDARGGREAAVQQFDFALARCRRLADELMRVTSFQLKPRAVPPSPYPMSPAWSAMFGLAQDVQGEVSLAPRIAASFAKAEVQTADVQYLYERWCGLKILGGLRQLGFVVASSGQDPALAILLGGHLEFRRESDGLTMELWCEPFLESKGDHPSGLRSLTLEASPDFVLITPGPHGTDAFVLDATLSADPHDHQRKASYLTKIAFDRLVLIAGVPTRPIFPKRSWAAAPIDKLHCELLKPDGSTGIVPLHGDIGEALGLRHWLQDVVNHAEAWGKKHLS